jgi:inorganic pyrophosphatase
MSRRSAFDHWRPHPWHGLDVGPHPPTFVNAYIEMTPFDLVKYELDKVTGYLRVDRPQHTSSQLPTLYGFIPRTYCGPRVAALMPHATHGDHDPLDICVISERPITKSDIILPARVVGGLPMLDGGEADDKIIAVLPNDNLWADVEAIAELPDVLVERLRHYFSTYKLISGKPSQVSIDAVYDRKQAEQVIEAAMADYQETYGQPDRAPMQPELDL